MDLFPKALVNVCKRGKDPASLVGVDLHCPKAPAKDWRRRKVPIPLFHVTVCRKARTNGWKHSKIPTSLFGIELCRKVQTKGCKHSKLPACLFGMDVSRKFRRKRRKRVDIPDSAIVALIEDDFAFREYL